MYRQRTSKLTALFPEHQTGGPGTVICAVEVDRTNAIPVFHLVIQSTSFCWDTGVRYHDIQSPEVVDNFANSLLHSLIILDRDLVRLGLDPEVLCNGRCKLPCLLRRVIPDSKLFSI